MKRAVALGRHQRGLLIEASGGPTPIAKSPLSKEAIRRRRAAAEGLIRLELVLQCVIKSPQHPRGVLAIELTAIGRAMVRDFGEELVTGARMRWEAKGWQVVTAAERPSGDVALPAEPDEPAEPALPSPVAIEAAGSAQNTRPSSRLWMALQIAAAAVLSRAA